VEGYFAVDSPPQIEAVKKILGRREHELVARKVAGIDIHGALSIAGVAGLDIVRPELDAGQLPAFDRPAKDGVEFLEPVSHLRRVVVAPGEADRAIAGLDLAEALLKTVHDRRGVEIRSVHDCDEEFDPLGGMRGSHGVKNKSFP